MFLHRDRCPRHPVPTDPPVSQSAFQGLVDQAIKEIEIRNNKIEIKEAITTQALTNLKKKLNDNGIKSKRIFNKIKKKSETDYAWNLLISIKYSWKLNVNINEIEQKLIALGYIDSNNPDTIKEKEKLIAEEKNKNLLKNLLIKEKKNHVIQYFCHQTRYDPSLVKTR